MPWAEEEGMELDVGGKEERNEGYKREGMKKRKKEELKEPREERGI